MTKTDNGINFAVGIHKLEILPHENADALEIAVIGGYRAVVPKGVYKTNEYALYIPEAALVPDELLEELGLTGRLSGSGKNRVKAIRLRGVVSQGIVCRPTALGFPEEFWSNQDGLLETLVNKEREPTDFAELLGIEKWRPKVPGQMRGKIRERGPARILPWIEIPNAKKPGVERQFREGMLVIATEKIHGTHCMVTLAKVLHQEDNDETGATAGQWAGEWEILVSSKGLGKQGWDLVEEDGNVYWRAVREYKLEEWLRAFVRATNWEGNEPDRIGLYGEVYGASIQDLDYGYKGTDIGYKAFDLKIGDDWVNQGLFFMFTEGMRRAGGPDLPTVPVLYHGPYDHAVLVELASGMSLVGGGHIREGLVVRPQIEDRDNSGARLIMKVISDDYLLRKGETTEFE